MAYCDQCGDKVADNDVFCPSCGIALQPVIAAEADDKAGDFDAPAAAEQSDLPKQAVDDLAARATEEQINIGDAPAEISAPENHLPAPTVDAPVLEPANAVADEADKSEEKTILANVSNIEISEPTATNDETIENNEEIAAEVDKTVENFDLPTAQSIAADTMPPLAAAANPAFEIDSFDKSDGDPEESFDLPSVQNFDAADFDAPNEMPPTFESKDSAAENINPPDEIAAAENETPAEEAIQIPIQELPEVVTPPSEFVSVRIMEDKPPSEIQNDFVPSLAKVETESAAPQVAEIEQKPEEKKSATQPSFGSGGDTDNKKAQKLKPLDEGTVLNNRYEIVRKIGGGGMGAVYLASDKNLGGVLRAVKEMVQSYIEEAQQEKAVNDFKRESMLLTTLDHPAIPTIYDYFYDETEARFYLVMKYISGGDLASRLRSAPEGRISEADVTNWAAQIADVLDYLHNHQPPIVYRDLKPANIMIDNNSGRVMLIDFGIARWVNKEEKGVTAVGTMGYAPPELFSGNVEPRSDIYSLGSTMFHLLTGADPQSNPLLIFDFQKNPRPRQINSMLSDQMEKILMRAVEYNAEKRFASAAEMRDALEEHLASLKASDVTFGVRETPTTHGLEDEPVFCGFCGQRIVATDLFCAFCGASQPLAQKGVHSEIYSPVPLTAQLVIVGTSELETPSFRLEKDENLVGRRDPMSNIFPEVDLSKYDPQTKISRRHARIWRDGNEFLVEDLGSSNGTYLLPVVSDTVRLQPNQPRALTSGDKIKLGDTTLHFVLG